MNDKSENFYAIDEGQCIKIQVSDVDYTVVFHRQSAEFFEDDIEKMLINYQTIYSIVFAVSEYIEDFNYQGDLYAPPKNAKINENTLTFPYYKKN
ncbi:hypothetical protein B0187_05235 [Haemophilus paracuniculus]|uniref:Uncharacterized protein n=1 Tax=Haemophilus paracuniculus TaxID=734 RepID=A0A1T0ARN0_9PAST|nr:hypothetical protein [Haemophilus paracuniculus]OOR99162.1 hypothetical protein B0187_05235 [Haemophilus paracuniculus]